MPVRIVNIRHLRGVNAWSDVGALRAVIGDLPGEAMGTEDAQRLEGEIERLCVPPVLARAAAERRQRRPAPREPADCVVELAGELQFLCGEFRGICEVFGATAGGVCSVVLECRVFALAEACLRGAIDYLNAMRMGSEPSLAETFAALLATAEDVCPVSSPGLVVSAAYDRGIPVFRLGPDQAFCLAPDEVLQLGEGIYQRRLHPWGTMTDRTGFLAGHLANDKPFVKALWSQYGIPVPAGMVVSDESGARLAAAALGGPVVVKPIDAECSRGLTLNSATSEAVSAAFLRAKAASTSGHVLVERYLPGAWHRLLVVDQRLVAALRREPAGVVGDGRHSIRDLVAAINRDSRRGPDHRWPLRFLELGETEVEVLAAAGLTPDSVPASGRRVALRVTASAASGAESIDVTEHIHPETREQALEAVGLLGLDIAGLDLIASDISQPLAEQQGAFLEINEQPAIFLHAAPLCSPPRPVGEAIVELLFPGGHNGRVPLVVVIGRQIANRTAAVLAGLLAGTGRTVGLSTPEVTQLDDRPVNPLTASLPDRLHVLLRHPRTEVVVVSAPLQDIVRSGLGTDRCTVLVLAEGPSATMGDGDDTSRDEVDRLMRRLSGAAQKWVVNMADATWQECATTRSPDVCLVAQKVDHPGVYEHLTAGGMAAILEPSGIIIQACGTQTRHYPAAAECDDPAGSEGRIAHALATAACVVLTGTLGTADSESPAVMRSSRKTGPEAGNSQDHPKRIGPAFATM